MRTVLKRVLLHIAPGTITRNSSDSRRLPIGTRNSSSDCDSFIFASSIESLLLLVVINTEELSSALQFLG